TSVLSGKDRLVEVVPPRQVLLGVTSAILRKAGTPMANFSVKLVDHTQGSAKLRPLIQKPLQDLFNEVFDGTSDSATVDWGTGMPSDQIVLHFVEDVAGSYLSQKMPGNNIRGDAGGHTRLQNGITGSEFYKVAVFDGKPTQVK